MEESLAPGFPLAQERYGAGLHHAHQPSHSPHAISGNPGFSCALDAEGLIEEDIRYGDDLSSKPSIESVLNRRWIFSTA